MTFDMQGICRTVPGSGIAGGAIQRPDSRYAASEPQLSSATEPEDSEHALRIDGLNSHGTHVRVDRRRV